MKMSSPPMASLALLLLGNGRGAVCDGGRGEAVRSTGGSRGGLPAPGTVGEGRLAPSTLAQKAPCFCGRACFYAKEAA